MEGEWTFFGLGLYWSSFCDSLSCCINVAVGESEAARPWIRRRRSPRQPSRRSPSSRSVLCLPRWRGTSTRSHRSFRQILRASTRSFVCWPAPSPCPTSSLGPSSGDHVSLADAVRQHVVIGPSARSFVRLPGPSCVDQLPVLVQPVH